MKLEDLLSLLFIASVMLAPYVVNFIQNYQSPQIVYVKVEKRSKPKKKIKTQTIKKINPIDDNKIYNDCIDVLISMGMNKISSKEKVKNLFSYKQYASVQDFILDAYKIK